MILNTVRINGLQDSRETVIGIDYRPATGLLYGATQSNLYTIDPFTGAATKVVAFMPTTPSGGEFGFDFNPVVDRLRIVAESDQNLRVNPDTGAVIVDAALAYTDANAGKNPNVTGSAYLNPDNDPATVLYGIDSKLNLLVTQNPANAGSLQAVGSLGIDVDSLVGFDIAADNTAFASLTREGRFSKDGADLYSINLATGAATFLGDIGTRRDIRDIAVVLPQQPVFAVTSDNRLVTFNSAAPEVLTSSRAVTGLAGGETLLGIDFRPATGVLYGLGSANNVYTIDTKTGAATKVNTAALSGDQFGFDFNPVPDALRVTSDAEQNLRIVMGGTGTVNSDGALAYAATDVNAGKNPNVAGSAYINNFPGTTTTLLYGIDTNLNVLVTQNPANAGTLQTVGSLNVDVGAADLVGFDIGSGNVAYAAFRLEGETVSKFYRIDLATGAATLLTGRGAATDTTLNNEGVIGASRGGSPTIVGIAVAPSVVQFLKAETNVEEGGRPAAIVLARSGDTTGSVTVNYATTTGGTATAGADFTAVNATTITFAPGQSIAVFTVPVTNDRASEGIETVNVVLTNPTGGGATLGSQVQSSLVIFDDDRPRYGRFAFDFFDKFLDDDDLFDLRRRLRI